MDRHPCTQSQLASTAPTTGMVGWELSRRDDTHTARRSVATRPGPITHSHPTGRSAAYPTTPNSEGVLLATSAPHGATTLGSSAEGG